MSANRARMVSVFVLIGLAMLATALLVVTIPDSAERAERLRISFKRWSNGALAAAGHALPGTPDLARLDARLAEKELKTGAPIFIRIFKAEFELEMWVAANGTYRHFATYPICTWSGRLGPKLVTGDKQAPEGVFWVDAGAMNPQSRWHRSFNLGFPNAFDRAHGRTGSFLMVHGGCSSAGCYAMTNGVIDEIWTLADAALKAGQRRFQVQVLPFRMSEETMSRYDAHPAAPFWRQLKAGNDIFEGTRLPPRVHVCAGRYVFSPGDTVNDGGAPYEAGCERDKPASARGARS